MYTNKNYFDSYGRPPPVNITKQIITQSAFVGGIYSEYQIQKDDSYCAAYCLYVLYLTQIIGFTNAVLNLYYHTFKLNKRKELKVIQLNLKLYNQIIRKGLKIKKIIRLVFREKLSKQN